MTRYRLYQSMNSYSILAAQHLVIFVDAKVKVVLNHFKQAVLVLGSTRKFTELERHTVREQTLIQRVLPLTPTFSRLSNDHFFSG